MKNLCLVAVLLMPPMAAAELFEIPSDGSTVVGRLRVITPRADNTLLDIARRFDLGHHEITWANPDVDKWTPSPADRVIIPTQFILPPKPWEGIVINISQRRLFYFLPLQKGEPARVLTFPISIARQGWPTPLGKTRVVAKHKDPGWFVPKSIQQEKIAEGEINFPVYFPPGPDNPMGMLAIQTGFSGIYIHGTNRPWGVGMRTSHGCIHLYPEDAETLFPLMSAGIPIRVIDQPFVVGVAAGQLLMSSYRPVTDYGATSNQFTRAVLALAPWLESHQTELENKTKTTHRPYEIDWNTVKKLTEFTTVTPHSIAPGSLLLENSLDDIPVEAYDFPPYKESANDARPPTEEIGLDLEADEFDADNQQIDDAGLQTDGSSTEDIKIEGLDLDGYQGY